MSTSNKYMFVTLPKHGGSETKKTQAICQFDNTKDATKSYGYVIFTQNSNNTEISLHLQNLPPGLHGLHVHESADRRKGCDSAGPHYNPFHGQHGNINEKGNHLGDLGNIDVKSDGTCTDTIIANYLPLTGEHQIVGRSLVLHAGKDDLGKGGNAESKKTGNSGSRLTCGVIGFL